MLYEIFIGALSIIGLLAGAEIVIHEARKIAHELKISDFFIGLTIFSIGTSLPEIATHVVASIDILRGVGSAETLSGLAVGTNIGSNIIQITFITGVVALFGVLKARKKFLMVDYMVMLLSILALFIFSLDGNISRLEGFVLFFSYIAYLIYLTKAENLGKKFFYNISDKRDRFNLYTEIFVMLGGLIVLILSADRIADLVQIFSDKYKISGSLIGTLIVGVSTALPEFTTAIFALRKKSSGMSLGTLIGSNITNPLMALGLGAMISNYSVAKEIIFYDIPFWFAVSLALFFLIRKTRVLNKKVALFLILFYIMFAIARIYLF